MSWESVYIISHSWVYVLIFLHPFTWSITSCLMWFCDGSNKGTASDFMQILEKVQRRPWQWLDECLGKKAWAPDGKVQTNWDRKRWDEWRGKSRACSSFSLIKAIVNKEFVLAGQTVNSTYYCNVLQWLHKNMWRLAPNFGHHLNVLFSPGIFFPRNNITLVPQPSLIFSPYLIEDKTERPPF
jgi:hypothetical protein